MATSASTVCLPEDRAYLLHHFHCDTCISAGATPGKQARCQEGLRLWNLYLRAYQAQQRLTTEAGRAYFTTPKEKL